MSQDNDFLYINKIERRKTLITIIRDASLTKRHSFVNEQRVSQSASARSEYDATVISVDLKDIYEGLLQSKDVSLIYGYPVFEEKPIIGAIKILSKARFLELHPDAQPPFIKKYTAPEGAFFFELTRTIDNFRFADFALFDYDVDSSAPAHMQIQTTEEFLSILKSIDPCFKDVACLEVFSSSSGLISPTGEPLTGLMKRHLTFQITDGTDIPRFVNALVVKLINAGYYYFKTDKNGKQLLRTIIDTQVFSPNHLIYEAAPILQNGITQQRPQPRIVGA